MWNSKYWDLKTISTEKATDSAVRKGIKQIGYNGGGLIIQVAGDDFVEDILTLKIGYRLLRSAKSNIDIIVLQQNQLLKVLRYK